MALDQQRTWLPGCRPFGTTGRAIAPRMATELDEVTE